MSIASKTCNLCRKPTDRLFGLWDVLSCSEECDDKLDLALEVGSANLADENRQFPKVKASWENEAPLTIEDFSKKLLDNNKDFVENPNMYDVRQDRLQELTRLTEEFGGYTELKTITSEPLAGAARGGPDVTEEEKED